MSWFLNQFTSREFATLIWLVVILSVCLLNKKIRSGAIKVIIAFCEIKIVRLIAVMVVYMLGCLFLLRSLGYWNKDLLKDSCFWFVGVAMTLFFKVSSAKDTVFFKEIAIDSIKWIVLVEFLVNLYTFNFWIELFFVPFMLIVVLLQIVSAHRKEAQMNRIFTNIISLVGLFLIAFTLFKSVEYYQNTFSVSVLKEFLLPIILTLVFIPLLMLFAVYMNYELLFVRLKYFVKDEKRLRQFKREIKMQARLNLRKINRVAKNLPALGINEGQDVRTLVKNIVYIGSTKSIKNTSRMQETKNQHYVPRTYLKRFGEKRGKQTYIHKLPKDSLSETDVVESNTKKVCVDEHIYTLAGNTPEERMFIESLYGTDYENKYESVYNILMDRSKRDVSDDEKKLIISTVVTMLFRTQKMPVLYNEFIDRVIEDAFYSCQAANKDYFFFEKEKISIANKTLQQVQAENKKEAQPVMAIIQLQVALRLIDIRVQNDGMMVIKLEDEDCNFITSDNPVSHHLIDGSVISAFDWNNILFLPLDSKHQLMLIPGEKTNFLGRLSKKGISAKLCALSSNTEQQRNSQNILLGSSDALKTYLKTKEASERPVSDEDAPKTYKDLLNKLKDEGLI